MATTFKKFIYAGSSSAYLNTTGLNDGDIAFVGGSLKNSAQTPSSGSGIYTQGYFFPTPYRAEDLYTRSDIDGKLTTINTKLSNAVMKSSIGAANGVAGLDANKKVATANLPSSIVYTGTDGKIPASALPSYVDDVKDLAGVLDSVTATISANSVADPDSIYFYSNATALSPQPYFLAYKGGTYYRRWTSSDATKTEAAYGQSHTYLNGTSSTTTIECVIPVVDKIYIDTSNSKIYRWSGSTLAEISGCALSDTQATTLLNQYVKTIANGTATAVTNAAEIDVVTGAGNKTNSTTKAGATYTLARSKAATKTYVDKMSPSVVTKALVPGDNDTSDYVFAVSATTGTITKQATLQFETGSFRPLVIQTNGTTKSTYSPNKSMTLNLQTNDFVTWQII